MPEEAEVPLEQAHEDMHHQAHHAKEGWIPWVATTAAVLAVLAAITAALSGNHANMAMIEQMEKSDHFAWYQAKGIKASVLQTRIEILKAEGKEPAAKDLAKLDEYAKEQAEIKVKADALALSSHHHLETHEKLGPGVTMFQVAIAICAIAVLTKRPVFWYVGSVFGAVGIYFLLNGVYAGHLAKPEHGDEVHGAATAQSAPADAHAGHENHGH